MTVTMNQASRAAYGFQLTAVDAQGNRAGTFTTSDNRTQLLNGTGTFTGRRYIQHSISGISSNGANQASWTFKWRAPATPAGKITLYAAGNAANGTGTSSNDGSSRSPGACCRMTAGKHTVMARRLRVSATRSPAPC